MGYGSYTSEDWASLRKSAGITHEATANQIFRSTTIKPELDPKRILLRESRDSEDHPASTPVIIGLDVTGSMGFLAEEIAKNSLNETMLKLYDLKPVTDPQLMFAAIGDVTDRAPLQVTQFESDIRIGKQLLELWLEGNGGDMPEDYPLLWYFAAKHTAIDSWQKRKKKGILITIGDADCHPALSSASIARIFPDGMQKSDLTATALAEEAGRMYELFHIHLNSRYGFPVPILEKAIPGHVVRMNKDQVSILPDLIIGLMRMLNGMGAEAAAALTPEKERALRDCLKQVRIQSGSQGYSF